MEKNAYRVIGGALVTVVSLEAGGAFRMHDDQCLPRYGRVTICPQLTTEPPNYHSTHADYDTQTRESLQWIASGHVMVNSMTTNPNPLAADVRIRIGDCFFPVD